MSSSDEVREALIDMGVDPAKSHAASTMFGSVDAAINWVFGEGENVSFSCPHRLADKNSGSRQHSHPRRRTMSRRRSRVSCSLVVVS